MIRDLVEDEFCKWCGRALSRSFLTRLCPGIERGDWVLYPVLCVCGGITVIGACQFQSQFEELCKKKESGQ